MSDAALLAESHAERWCKSLLLSAFVFVAHATWTIVLLSGAIGKIINHGFFNYFRHYTNWSWTFQLLFFAATLPAPFVQTGLVRAHGALGSLTRTVIVLGLFPLFGVVTTVMALVFVLLGTMSDFITDIFQVMAPQIVIIGNDLFHMIPFVALLLFWLFYYKLVFYSLNHVAARYGVARDAVRLTLWIAYEGFFGAAVSLAFYSLLFDAREVYETDIPFITGAALAVFIILFSSGLSFLIVAALVGVVSERAYPQRWLTENNNDPLLVGALPGETSKAKSVARTGAVAKAE